MPIVFWQIWAFLAPAFAEHTSARWRCSSPSPPSSGWRGLAFGYWVVLPPADPLPDELRLVALRTSCSAPRTTTRFVSSRTHRRGAGIRGARVRARARPAADHDRGDAAADLADRRVRDGRDRGDPPGGRSGDDDPLGSSRFSSSTSSIAFAAFFEPRWRGRRRGRPSSRAGLAGRNAARPAAQRRAGDKRPPTGRPRGRRRRGAERPELEG